MDLRKVKKLIELLEESELGEMEITEGENTIRLSRSGSSSVPAAPQSIVVAPHPTNGIYQSPVAEDGYASPVEITRNTIDSPMVGTFYDSSSPDAEPYVSVGSHIKTGDILCVIEAMKTFNQLEADVEGTIKAIYKSNGDPIEYGEPLFLID